MTRTPVSTDPPEPRDSNSGPYLPQRRRGDPRSSVTRERDPHGTPGPSSWLVRGLYPRPVSDPHPTPQPGSRFNRGSNGWCETRVGDVCFTVVDKTKPSKTTVGVCGRFEQSRRHRPDNTGPRRDRGLWTRQRNDTTGTNTETPDPRKVDPNLLETFVVVNSGAGSSS